MSDLNMFIGTGYLAADPHLWTYNNGDKEGARFILSMNRAWIQGGERQEETTYMEVKAFGRIVERVRRLRKGNRVTVRGRLHNEKHDDPQTGKTHKLTKIYLDWVEVILVLPWEASPEGEGQGQTTGSGEGEGRGAGA